MKKYMKPSADVVEISFNGNIAAFTSGKNIFGSGVTGSSSDAGVNLFSEPNGTNSSNKPGISLPDDETENQ